MNLAAQKTLASNGGRRRDYITVEPEHYGVKYDSKRRFCSYWHQIHEVLSLNPSHVVEIGVGGGFVSSYLKAKGGRVTTVDIDGRLRPDVTGSVLELPLAAESCDVALCSQVLEHLAYSDFGKALEEMSRITRRYIVLSLPDVGRVCRVHLELPRYVRIKAMLSLPRFRKPGSKSRRVSLHHWEIGQDRYPMRRIRCDIEEAGLRILRTYRVYETPLHRMFILEKTGRPRDA